MHSQYSVLPMCWEMFGRISEDFSAERKLHSTTKRSSARVSSESFLSLQGMEEAQREKILEQKEQRLSKEQNLSDDSENAWKGIGR